MKMSSGGWTIDLQSERITSYDEARKLWLKREGYGKRHARRLATLDDKHEEPHALDGPKKHFSLRLLSLDDKRPLYSRSSMGDHAEKYESFELRHYAFRYHSTDCVVYREDDTLFISSGGYGTMSTNIFVSRFLPATVKVHFASSNSTSNTRPWSRNLLVLDDPTARHNYWHSEIEGRRVYQLAYSSVALTRLSDGSYRPLFPEVSTKLWEKLSIDKLHAREVCRSTRYHEFLRWALVYSSMRKLGYDLCRNPNHTDGWPSAGQWRTLLDDEASWPRILAIKTFHPTYPGRNYGHFERMRKRDPDYLHRLHVDRLGRAIRLALYQDSPDIIQAQSLPFVGSLSEVASCLASVARWQD